MNREQWLEAGTEWFRPTFETVGAPLPPIVKVTCGFTSKGARSNRIGECWIPEASAANVPEILIHPGRADSVEVGAILVHELVHAAGLRGHGQDFKRVALAVGLAGKMTATHAGDALVVRLTEMVAELGEYPHAVLSGNHAKKQSTRMLKMECEGCGFIARTTAKWLDEIGAPHCACEHGQMRVSG